MRKNSRFLENPFTQDMTIQTKNQMVILGKNDDVLISQNTGEFRRTHVTTYRKVDNEQFIKLFTQNIALTFELSSAGIKALNVVIWTVQRDALNRDIIAINQYDIDDFNDKNDRQVSVKTFYRGINELIKAQIVARHKANNTYFINPNFIFNGDRVAFTNLIERKKIINGSSNKETSEHSTEHPNQAKLPL